MMDGVSEEPTSSAIPAIASAETASPKTIELPMPVNHSLWLEVLAVLAVGVIPHLFNGISHYFAPISVSSNTDSVYWFECIQLIMMSACTIIVTAYLIYRSELTREQFGISPPHVRDIALGLVMLIVANILWHLTPTFYRSDHPETAFVLSTPRTSLDYFLMTVKYALAAGSEELVTRCYLIVRFSILLKYRGFAVLFAAMLFSSYHIYEGIDGVVYTFVFGIGFGGAFLMLRCIWPLLIGHALYNMQIELSAILTNNQ